MKYRFRLLIGLLAIFFSCVGCVSSLSLSKTQDTCPIVTVLTKNESGTGWVVGKDHVLTAWHAVNNDSPETTIYNSPISALPATVLVFGEEKDAKVVHAPPHRKSDLVLLKVDTKNLSPLPIATSSPSVGDAIFWFRENCENRYQATLKNIRIKRTGDVYIHGSMSIPYRVFEQEMLMVGEKHRHAVKRGASGSPLLNKDGEVVGMMTTIWGWGPSLNEILSFLQSYDNKTHQ